MRTKIMGVLNLTPDSFYDGDRYTSPDKALIQAQRMVDEGAHIIDIGGESSRPGAQPVTVEEELKRVIPIIEKINRRLPNVPISIDTRKAPVARRAYESGATIINDITGLQEPQMMSFIKEVNCFAVMMHMQGTPETMQNNPSYDDGNVVDQIFNFFERQLNKLEEFGIDRQRITVDPGIGFGKTLAHNLKLIRNLSRFKELTGSVLLGVSRKSFIGLILDLPVEERLEGSLAASVAAVMQGVDTLRVHDVKETVRAVRVAEAILEVE